MTDAIKKIELFYQLTAKTRKKDNRNAVPLHKGGRKKLPRKGGGGKLALLRRIHKDSDIQKLLEKHPQYDIILVKKKK